MAEYLKAFDHVGLLVKLAPGKPECPLFSHPTTATHVFIGVPKICR